MNDTTLLIFGIVVFSLMLAGVVMTVLEFRQLSRDKSTGLDQKPGHPGPDGESQSGD